MNPATTHVNLDAPAAFRALMKLFLAAFLLLLASALPAAAQSYYDIGLEVPTYPEMEPVPDSPVYYAPGVDSNYFFYDGLYWDFYGDNWYSSAWYNGPWAYVDPVYVPTYVLWVPIHYYRRPPAYFRGWHPGRPPRWTERWGRDWQQRHNAVYAGQSGPAPPRAPLPHYQRQFSGASYPRLPQQQQALRTQHYGYQPREQVTRQTYQGRGGDQNRPGDNSRGTDQGRGAETRR